MRYFVDFDRTLFDTDSFKEWLWQRESLASFAHLPSKERAVEAYRQLAEGVLVFAPGELTQFLFADAAQFLRDKENAATIITFGDSRFQEAKVKSAFQGIPRMSTMYTGNKKKAEYLAPHTHLHKGALLVDDAPLELEALAESCPELALYEMRRDGGSGDGRWPVIHALGELP